VKILWKRKVVATKTKKIAPVKETTTIAEKLKNKMTIIIILIRGSKQGALSYRSLEPCSPVGKREIAWLPTNPLPYLHVFPSLVMFSMSWRCVILCLIISPQFFFGLPLPLLRPITSNLSQVSPLHWNFCVPSLYMSKQSLILASRIFSLIVYPYIHHLVKLM